MSASPVDPWIDARSLAALLGATGQALFRVSGDWSAIAALPADGGPPGAPEPFDAWIEARVPPEEAPALRAAIGEARRAGSPLDAEHRALREDGTLGWLHLRAVPMAGPDGGVEAWMAAAADVTARREDLAHQRLLLAELQRRARNTLAVIRSVVRRGAEGSRGVADYAARVEGRVGVIARVQGAVIRNPEARLDLEGLLRDELVASAVAEGRVRIHGPPVPLASQAAEAMALAFHELVVRAIDRGALAAPDGTIDVAWSVAGADGAQQLDLAWTERGGASGRRPRRGGLDLLEKTLAYGLRARTSFAQGPAGLSCRIELPLAPDREAQPSVP